MAFDNNFVPLQPIPAAQIRFISSFNTTRAMTTSAINLLSQLIQTPSFSREETAAADIVEQFIASHHHTPHRHGNNVWALSPHWHDDRPTILLDAHIDTVRPTSGWTRHPFTPSIEGDRLYGLGANDDGGSLVSLLHVFLNLTAQDDTNPQPYNLIFLASSEEEVSGKGGIESVLPLLPHTDFAIVGEPTGMQPAVAEKGLMVVDVTTTGKSGHAARDEGENAIYKAMDDICWIRQHQFSRLSPLLGPVKMTVTIINAGTAHNVIPAQCSYTIDIRSNELYTNQEILDEISRHLQGHPTPRSLRLSSSATGTEHPILLRTQQLGLKPFGSPTLSNQALIPFPSIKIGPGQSARSHTADEFILVSEIQQAIELYTKLLQ